MGIRIIKPTTPGNRFSTRSDFEHLTCNEPEKSLTTALRKSGGRNNNGRITVRHHGGGHHGEGTREKGEWRREKGHHGGGIVEEASWTRHHEEAARTK